MGSLLRGVGSKIGAGGGVVKRALSEGRAAILVGQLGEKEGWASLQLEHLESVAPQQSGTGLRLPPLSHPSLEQRWAARVWLREHMGQVG